MRTMHVFFHGFPDQTEVWENQIKDLDPNSYICVDLWKYAEQDQLIPEDVCSSLLVELNNKNLLNNSDINWIITGHDLGAPFAIHLAQVLPAKNIHLIVMNGVSAQQLLGRFKHVRQLLKSWYIGAIQIPGLTTTVKRFFPQWPLKIAEKSYPAPVQFSERSLEGFKIYKALFRQTLLQPQSKNNHRQIPTTVIWGKNDPFLELPNQEEFKFLCRKPEIYILNCGHWPQLEQVEHVNYVYDKITKSFSHEQHASHLS